MGDRRFHELYEEWMWPPPRRKRIERELHARYREAWRTGSKYDRSAVLYYLMAAGDASGADILIDALRTVGPALASAAGANAVSIVIRGFDLGPEARAAFVTYGKRHPKWSIFASVALECLSARQKADRPLIRALAATAKRRHQRVGVAYRTFADELADKYTAADPEGARFVVKVDARAGLVRTYRVFDVVEVVSSKYREKTVEDARALRDDAALGEQVLLAGSPGFKGWLAGEALKSRALGSLDGV